MNKKNPLQNDLLNCIDDETLKSQTLAIKFQERCWIFS